MSVALDVPIHWWTWRARVSVCMCVVVAALLLVHAVLHRLGANTMPRDARATPSHAIATETVRMRPGYEFDWPAHANALVNTGGQAGRQSAAFARTVDHDVVQRGPQPAAAPPTLAAARSRDGRDLSTLADIADAAGLEIDRLTRDPTMSDAPGGAAASR